MQFQLVSCFSGGQTRWGGDELTCYYNITSGDDQLSILVILTAVKTAVRKQKMTQLYNQERRIRQSRRLRWHTGQSQQVVSAYFTSEQILPFGFSKQMCTLNCQIVFSHLKLEIVWHQQFSAFDDRDNFVQYRVELCNSGQLVIKFEFDYWNIYTLLIRIKIESEA